MGPMLIKRRLELSLRWPRANYSIASKLEGQPATGGNSCFFSQSRQMDVSCSAGTSFIMPLLRW
jgi:hypothetical protein